MKSTSHSNSSFRNIVMFVVVSWSVTLACVLQPAAPSGQNIQAPAASSMLQPF